MSNSSSDDSINVRVWWAMLSLIAAGFLLWTFGELRAATSARWQDTSGYLSHALYVAEHGGFWGFLREAFTGVFPLTERHPLQFLMIAPFASRTEDFMWIAKLVDLVTGFVVLLSLVWMVNRRYGRGPALIAGLLYAVSSSLVVAASHVNCETQLVLGTLWAWWFLTDARHNRADDSEMPTSATPWAIAGICLGLAFLAKSSAILMGVAVAVAGLWYARLKFLAGPRFWAFLATAVLVSSPLLVRNVVGFGTPLYEGIVSYMFWIDDWTELGAEHSVIYYDNYGVMTIEQNGLPTAADYFRTHSITDVFARLAQGAYNQFRDAIPGALGSPVLPVGRRIIGFAVFGLALAGWWFRRRSWDATLTFFWSSAFIAFFSWDTLFTEIRYLAPLVPVWIAYAAYAVWRIGAALVTTRTAWRLQVAVSCAIVALTLGSTIATGELTQPRPVMQVSPSYYRLIDWLNRSAEPGDRIMIGETREFHGLLWMVEPRINVVLNPNATTLEGFLRYLHGRKVRYLLMHPEYLSGENREIAAALEPYFEMTAEGAFREKRPLPGWRPVYADEEIPGHFIMYEAIEDPNIP